MKSCRATCGSWTTETRKELDGGCERERTDSTWRRRRQERQDGIDWETSKWRNEQEDGCLQLARFIDDIQSVAAHLSHRCCCGAVTATHQVTVAGAAAARGVCGVTTGNGIKGGSVHVQANDKQWMVETEGCLYSKRSEDRWVSSSPRPSLQWKNLDSSSSPIHVRFF